RRRYRNARRRGADDAAGRRRQLRRLWDLQERGPGPARAGNRRGDDPLRGPGPRRGRDVGAGRGDARVGDRRAGGGRQAAGSRLVSTPKPLQVGVLAVQGDYAAHGRVLRELGAAASKVRTPAELEGLDGLIVPGGESTTITMG